MSKDNKPKPNATAAKSKLHRRNKHKHRYNFERLMEEIPALKEHVAINKYGSETIDFFNAEAVKLLNQALLKKDYGIEFWDIPAGYLCPPIPGRADYIHHAADILAGDDNKRLPKGPLVRVLDIGTGANCIYPILGTVEYGWSFVGADIDPTSVKAASSIAKANQLKLEIRLQKDADKIFKGVVEESEYFDLTTCNPPFHSSAEEAKNSNRRKVKNLTKGKAVNNKGKKPKEALSFGGQNNELSYPGGEIKFITRMIKESADYKGRVLWFSTLVSKQGNLKEIYKTLRSLKTEEVRTIEMAQGNKSSRIVAWTFHTPSERIWWRRNSSKTAVT